MRIVFITPEEPFHLPVFFNTVLSARHRDTAGVVVITPLYKNNTWFSQTRRVIKIFGWRVFFVEALSFSYSKLLDRLSRFFSFKRFYSVKSVARHYRCPIHEPEDINDPAFLARLRRLSPDVIVSVSSPQIFKDELIDLPRLGCINIHGSKLPKYRGILPSFWMLANNEEKAGVTVHYINKGVDDGDIIAQREYDILPNDTLHSLVTRSKRLGAELLLQTLDMLEQGNVESQPNLFDEGSYYSWPTRENVKMFRQYGRSFR